MQSNVGDTENVIESAGWGIAHRAWAQRPKPQMSLAPVDVDLDIQRIAVLLKELAPAAGLSVVVVHQFLKADP
jgi:hypothetical protein